MGSPHTPSGYIWHIALAMQGLTSNDEGEKTGLMQTLLATDAGTRLMHEGFNSNDPTAFTREWFAWANSLICIICNGVLWTDKSRIKNHCDRSIKLWVRFKRRAKNTDVSL